MPSSAVVRVPGKINLQLSVGPLQRDGFHPVATVFQAVSLCDDVKVAISGHEGIQLSVTGKNSDHIPLDENNLAYKAAQIMSKKFEISDGLSISLTKEIPTAGGMAGGSADAAATLVAMDALFNLEMSREELHSLGSELGSDVPFMISGGTAIGQGHGDQLTAALSRGTYHWVLALSSVGLSTPAVYAECDRMRAELEVAAPVVSDSLMQSLLAADAEAVGKALVNDLQNAACSLRPALSLVLEVGRDYGALGAIVSGSGPTVAFLVADEDAGLDLAVALTASGVVGSVARAHGPVHGAKVI